ncbi:MAG: response regulator [Desulfobacterales bacterium]|nr:response regulator [Desulfobacterales bacterium]
MTATALSQSILIVDDTPDNLTVLRQILTRHGYRVRPAISGEIALKAIQADPPDLILLDILMPGMDGFEVCRKLKINQNTRRIPIIFISALDDEDEKVRAFEEGGADYITKPFNSGEVLARINTQLTISALTGQLKQKTIQFRKALDDIRHLRASRHLCPDCKKELDKG